MIMEKLYRIASIEHAGNRINARIVLDPGAEIFKGHFPGQPVLPGVCSVQMIGDILSGVFGTEIFINEVSSCKYLKIVDPVKEPVLNMEIDYIREADRIAVNASGAIENGEPYLKIKASAIC